MNRRMYLVGTVNLWGRAHGSQSPRMYPLRAASVALGHVGLEREREVHRLTRRGAVEAPLIRQGGDQHEAPPGLIIGGGVYQHRQAARRVVDIDAQLVAGTCDGQRDDPG